MNYLDELKKRKKESKVYTKHQLVGLEISEILRDEEHKSLYMKLAKERKPEELLRIAKDIASRENVENKGAYFMRILNASPKNGTNTKHQK